VYGFVYGLAVVEGKLDQIPHPRKTFANPVVNEIGERFLMNLE